MDEITLADVAAQPDEKIQFVPAKGGESFSLGKITIRILEDGSNTSQRIGAADFTLPPHTPGPPAHWHEMHDETFLVTKGIVRFHIQGPHGESTVDAKVGDYVVVPVRAPHTFSNPFDEEAVSWEVSYRSPEPVFFNTFTPSFYINYFKLLATMVEQGKPMSKEANLKAMSHFATLPANLSD